ncbi:unnamed protein product [Rotaria sp. Silwood2]|nr:unnamed protein product [Rotaria sp. Silwood2]CAF4282502.1 unnamed protein product [Rotaria sp. Silwood2]
MEKRVDELIETFRTPFWLDEHQWFVRCHWESQEPRQNTHLYTLPYCHDTLSNWTSNLYCKSNCPSDQDFFSYNNVRVIEYLYGTDIWLSSIRFPNIRDMSIGFPTHETIWSSIPTLDNLISLTIWLNQDACISDVQALINRTHRLYSLTLRGNVGFQLWKIKSISIRRLDLTRIGYFTVAQCSALINSLLGRQCQVLLIHVMNRSQILNIVNTIPNLRALHCRCGDNLKIRDRSSSAKNELLVWLRNRKPSNFSIGREVS